MQAVRSRTGSTFPDHQGISMRLREVNPRMWQYDVKHCISEHIVLSDNSGGASESLITAL
jgi:hypothetical protein